MQEPRRSSAKKTTEDEVKERHSEATSKETLTDLENSEKISDAKRSQHDERELPSPDGTKEESIRDES